MIKKHFSRYTSWYVILICLLVVISLYRHFSREIARIDHDIELHKNK